MTDQEFKTAVQFADQRAALINALIQAQKEMNDPLKSAYNPGFKSKFADLGAHLESVREPLRKHGLTVMQTMDSENGTHFLVTTLFHLGGGFLTSRTALVLAKNDMQGYGSAVTYARRYAIASMFALYGDTDDDGNEASAPAAGPKASPQEALYVNAKQRMLSAKTPAEKQKILALCATLPPVQQAELQALAAGK